MRFRVFFIVLAVLMMIHVFSVSSCQLDASPLNYEGNNCLNYDGFDDYTSAGDFQVFKPSSTLTIETWLKPRYAIRVGSHSEYGHEWGEVVSCNHAGGNGYWLEFNYGEGLLYFGFTRNGAGSYSYRSNRNQWSNISWSHLTVTYNSSLPKNNVKILVNGRVDAEYNETRAIIYDDGPLQFGKLSNWAWGGSIDEIRLWNISRSQNQIKKSMNRTLILTETSDPSLVGYWRFDEGSGNISQDHSIYGHEATIFGSEWVLGAPIIPEFSSVFVGLTTMALSMITILVEVRYRRRKRTSTCND